MLRRFTLFGFLLAMLAIAIVRPGRAIQTQASPTPGFVPAQTESPEADAAAAASPTPLPPTAAPTAASPQNAAQTPVVVVQLLHSEPPEIGVGPEQYPIGVNPLSGLLVEDPSLLERRPLVVKVTNYPRSVRPQSGLSQADLVYEYYMERGITRFIAVFYGQDAEKVGPVRSGRFFDEHIFRMYDGFFVFGSADKRVLNNFLQLGVHFVNSFVLESEEDREVACGPGKFVPLCREEEIESYNNLFTNTAALTRYVGRRGNSNYRPNLNGMYFAAAAPLTEQLGMTLNFRFSLVMYNRWEYEPEIGKYLRFQENIGSSNPNFTSYAPHTDALTGQWITADNVVTLIVPHEYYVKTNTTEIIDIHLEGAGRAYVFRNGFAYPAVWLRPQNGVLTLLDGRGEHFPLKPGNTWFEVVSEETAIENGGADWKFTFAMPEYPWGGINPERAVLP